MQQPPLVLHRALNTHLFKKDVVELGGVRDRNPASILGKAQDSLYCAKNGFRRMLAASSTDDPDAPDEPETVDLVEPVPGPAPDEAFASHPRGVSRAGKARRSSMTTFTIDLGGAPGGSVEREVRRLAGLPTTGAAFARASADPSGAGAGAGAAAAAGHPGASFDDVMELTIDHRRLVSGGGGLPGASGAAGAAAYSEVDDEDGDDDASYAFQGGSSSGLAGGGMVSRPTAGPRQGFGFSSGTNVAFDSGGGATAASRAARRRSSTCNDIVVAIGGGSPHSNGGGSLGGGSLGGGAGSGAHARESLELVDLRSGGGSAASLPDVGPPRPGTSVRGGGGSSPFVAPVGHVGAVSTGQLGFMRDRKGSVGAGGGGGGAGGTWGAQRGGTQEGYGSPPAHAHSIPSGGSDTLLKLPTLGNPSRAASAAQLLAPSAASSGALVVPDSRPASRPASSRMLLPRNQGSSADAVPAGAAAGAPPMPMRVSLPGGAAGGPRLSMADGGMDGTYGGGGRWFQQDVEDVEAVMAEGDEAMLRRIMTTGALPSAPEDEYGEPFQLPRLTDILPDKAAATLGELRKFQAHFDDHMSKERQAIAQGRVRRSSALEDAVGNQQPRWVMTYHQESQSVHSKIVDPTRRSELDKMHLARLMRDKDAARQPAGAAAAVSPVVARARRLSTVAM
ncbi:hypothetical protein GPECTOR_12g566 [Gonium pectorale]|uniref:Uncharacterized protein n=1 Tax=Gonium pectorale TaxID=33097 RepID=A0A150GPE0_GONPE|nr:hypothetical protein GPECTOR_12g566 [Gonium pectorale]|eukprot:KXZ51602.1 hypothetical protein GPECTOR_12g566 [Gonium pectorale]